MLIYCYPKQLILIQERPALPLILFLVPLGTETSLLGEALLRPKKLV